MRCKLSATLAASVIIAAGLSPSRVGGQEIRFPDAAASEKLKEELLKEEAERARHLDLVLNEEGRSFLAEIRPLFAAASKLVLVHPEYRTLKSCEREVEEGIERWCGRGERSPHLPAGRLQDARELLAAALRAQISVPPRRGPSPFGSVKKPAAPVAKATPVDGVDKREDQVAIVEAFSFSLLRGEAEQIAGFCDYFKRATPADRRAAAKALKFVRLCWEEAMSRTGQNRETSFGMMKSILGERRRELAAEQVGPLVNALAAGNFPGAAYFTDQVGHQTPESPAGTAADGRWLDVGRECYRGLVGDSGQVPPAATRPTGPER